MSGAFAFDAALRRMILAVCVPAVGCGGASPSLPTASTPPPAPTPLPSPTPTPRVNVTLNAPSDSSRFSAQLALLNVGASIDIDFWPLGVNSVGGERFGHAIEFWLIADTSVPIDLEQRGELDSALSLVWSPSTKDWVVAWNSNATGYVYSPRRLAVPFGVMRNMRIRRTREGYADFFLDGERIMQLVNPAASRRVYVRAYATTLEFSYVPGVFGTSFNPAVSQLSPRGAAVRGLVESGARRRAGGSSLLPELPRPQLVDRVVPGHEVARRGGEDDVGLVVNVADRIEHRSPPWIQGRLGKSA